jgi:hypothetical protein
MYKQHLLFNLKREIDLIRQIAPLIKEKDLDYRPYEKARSTYQLMQYVSHIGGNMLRWFIDNDLNADEWAEIRENYNTLTINNFSTHLDAQIAMIEKYMDGITEEDLLTKEVEMPWKEKMVLGAAIINAPIKWLCAYRKELFIYLKMNGNTDISTKEAWTIME